jgi:hypothetical protein
MQETILKIGRQYPSHPVDVYKWLVCGGTSAENTRLQIILFLPLLILITASTSTHSRAVP